MVNSMLTLQTPTRTQKLRIPDDIANWHQLKVTKQQFFLEKKKKKKKRKEKEKFPISSLSSSLAGQESYHSTQEIGEMQKIIESTDVIGHSIESPAPNEVHIEEDDSEK